MLRQKRQKGCVQNKKCQMEARMMYSWDKIECIGKVSDTVEEYIGHKKLRFTGRKKIKSQEKGGSHTMCTCV